jgi:hypothetical protein
MCAFRLVTALMATRSGANQQETDLMGGKWEILFTCTRFSRVGIRRSVLGAK